MYPIGKINLGNCRQSAKPKSFGEWLIDESAIYDKKLLKSLDDKNTFIRAVVNVTKTPNKLLTSILSVLSLATGSWNVSRASNDSLSLANRISGWLSTIAPIASIIGINVVANTAAREAKNKKTTQPEDVLLTKDSRNLSDKKIVNQIMQNYFIQLQESNFIYDLEDIAHSVPLQELTSVAASTQNNSIKIDKNTDCFFIETYDNSSKGNTLPSAVIKGEWIYKIRLEFKEPSLGKIFTSSDVVRVSVLCKKINADQPFVKVSTYEKSFEALLNEGWITIDTAVSKDHYNQLVNFFPESMQVKINQIAERIKDASCDLKVAS